MSLKCRPTHFNKSCSLITEILEDVIDYIFLLKSSDGFLINMHSLMWFMTNILVA